MDELSLNILVKFLFLVKKEKMSDLRFGYLLAVILTAFASINMWGCSDKVFFDWGEYRSDESVAGFINDSLVIVTDCRRWHKITEGWRGSYSEETSCGHDRVLIYNYRVQEDRPRWTDSITNQGDGGFWKQLTDSIICVSLHRPLLYLILYKI